MAKKQTITEYMIELQQNINENANQENWEKLSIDEIADISELFELKYDASELTMIDIFKGIIPLKITDLILKKVKKKNNMEKIITEIQTSLQRKFWILWQNRCKELEIIDKEDYNIDKKVKKNNYNLEPYQQNR